MALPEEDVEVFELFQFWLYSDRLLDTDESVADLKRKSPHRPLPICGGSLHTAAAEHDHQCSFLNIKVTKKFPAGDVHRIYDNTTETSPLRRLLVDMGARVGELGCDWFHREKDNLYNNAFLIDLVLALYHEKLKKSPHDFTQLRCNYHIHSEAEKCCVPQEWR